MTEDFNERLSRFLGHLKWRMRRYGRLYFRMRPQAEVTVEGDVIKVAVDMPGITVRPYGFRRRSGTIIVDVIFNDILVIDAYDEDREYHAEVELPVPARLVEYRYRNGVLYVVLQVKREPSGLGTKP